MVQRGHIYAIVDEVDSILIDEARTPLIISGPLDDRSDFYNTIDAYHPEARQDRLRGRREAAHRRRSPKPAWRSWSSCCARPDLLKGESLYDVENVSIVHHVNQALRAHKLFQRDKDYIVRNGEVVIIDEFTGRMMPGRRYSEGLHQALEAKEHQPIQPENQTLASITFQNYFRMYEKLAGMTGTALTEADEFMDIYNLEVLEVPTNMPMIRDDEDDEVYRTNAEKYRAIITLLEDCKVTRPAGAGRHHLDREVRAARRDAAQGGLGAARLHRSERLRRALYRRRGRQEDQGLRHPQRALPRAGSLHRLARPACRARSPSPPTWPAAAPTSSSAATPTCASARSCNDIDGQAARARRRAPPRSATQVARLKETALDGRRPVRARHRAPREPPHRQPAARPLRPPGRSRPLEVLPVARRRPDAHLRLRQARRHAEQARPEGGRGDRPSLDQQGAGEGAAEGRGAQLRHPQEPPEVRQRDERPAQGHLRPARRADDGRERRRDRRRHAPRGDRRSGRQARAGERLSGAVGHRRACKEELDARARPRPAGRSNGPRKKASPTRSCSRASSGAPTSTWPPRSPNGARTSCAMSRSRSCCRRSTISGASIS